MPPSKRAATTRGKRSTNDNDTPAPQGKGLRRSLVEQEILDRAAALFAERGYPGTTLQDLADSLGMSRPALYYYVRSKEAILDRLVQNLSAENARALDAIRARRKSSPPEKLRAMAYHLAFTAISHPQQSRILLENRHHLPADLAEADRKAERSVLRNIQSALEGGVKNGEFRVSDPRTAALSIIGMCLWTSWWVDPGTNRAEDLAEQIADQAVNSVAAVARGSDRSDPGEVLRVVREDLEHLQQLL